MTTRDADGDVARTAAESGEEGTLSRMGSGSLVLDRARSAGERVAAAVRASWLYRWLTAEPDPDVIVIDLRETWTVGPFLRILDRVLDLLIGAVEGSIVATAAATAVERTRETPLRVAGALAVGAGSIAFLAAVAGDAVSRTLLAGALVLYAVGFVAMRDRRSWSELRDTRPVELLIRALEPPAPPETDDPRPEPDSSSDADDPVADDPVAGPDSDDARSDR
ncbi:hypothetical protein [Halorubrum halodurans]|uniref:Uncharacterized protein n=1 Tax=Halorubrum halodurans TaxID=1383851 RepID=A0A256IRG2_9EURY|nr:hypothetical protein [Halorubrum halodurans]OYR59033.1 hypothetical protein DJ70_01530 [Halorubrum halodurans]